MAYKRFFNPSKMEIKSPKEKDLFCHIRTPAVQPMS